MRIGMNPLRDKPAPDNIKDIVFVVVTHLPCEEHPDYHKDRLEVIKTCLTSMRNGAKREHTFMVWDNGSNSTFRDWLQHIFEPDILVLSPNIGKTQARTNAIRMLPLESLICYSDDDILYYDNWLSPQIKLLNHFNASIVSGYPVRTMFRWGNVNTLEWARKNGKLEQGRFIPREWEDDYAISVGRDPQQHVQMTVKDVDYRITFNGEQAYCTAHHCQFIGYGAKLLPALTYDWMAMGDERVFDNTIDKSGLRLCTTERLCRHIGNVVDDKIKSEIMVSV